jgi:lipopolysaccharide transport system ATP-binding protein
MNDDDTILKVENISKQYRLGLVGTGTLSHDLNRWWHLVRGKEDPYLKIGESSDRTKKGNSDYVWAIKSVGFELKKGDVLGIIGRNGAGKSTLLKILSRVTSPTTGSIKARGRIASLLEVGTGFHPELTGKENIYLNGAILGMTKKEIDSKYDEIVEFSGCEKYVETPVKRYSSGMKVRLAFAVAAHLEPEILVVDEVLAVGDAEFQKKAIGKMKDISRGGGRTVLFVSHNMASIQNLCNKCVVMENGQVIYTGLVEDSINFYLKKSSEISKSFSLKQRIDRDGGENFRFIDLFFTDKNNDRLNTLISGISCNIIINYSLKKDLRVKSFRMLLIDNKGVIRVLCNSSLVEKTPKLLYKTEKGRIVFKFDKFPLPKGSFNIQLSCFSDNGIEDDIENVIDFDVESGDFYGYGKQAHITDGVLVNFDFNIFE